LSSVCDPKKNKNKAKVRPALHAGKNLAVLKIVPFGHKSSSILPCCFKKKVPFKKTSLNYRKVHK
jgi:hypothetical protein